MTAAMQQAAMAAAMPANVAPAGGPAHRASDDQDFGDFEGPGRYARLGRKALLIETGMHEMFGSACQQRHHVWEFSSCSAFTRGRATVCQAKVLEPD